MSKNSPRAEIEKEIQDRQRAFIPKKIEEKPPSEVPDGAKPSESPEDLKEEPIRGKGFILVPDPVKSPQFKSPLKVAEEKAEHEIKEEHTELPKPGRGRGAKLCPNCSTKNALDAKFCHQCRMPI